MDLIGYNKRVQKDKVTGFEKFAYGCGEISTNIVFTIATSLLTMVLYRCGTCFSGNDRYDHCDIPNI